jgi:hypothetical protein
LQTVHQHPVQNAPRSHSAAKLIHVQITAISRTRSAISVWLRIFRTDHFGQVDFVATR